MTTSKKKLNLARNLSKTFHDGQSYGLENYFEFHIEGVVKSLALHNLCNKYLIVAYLHDIVEDTDIDISTITNLFGEEISAAVGAITKRNGENRIEYLGRVRLNPIARLVKVHDALFNLTNCHKNKNKTNYNKYIQTISLLEQE